MATGSAWLSCSSDVRMESKVTLSVLYDEIDGIERNGKAQCDVHAIVVRSSRH